MGVLKDLDKICELSPVSKRSMEQAMKILKDNDCELVEIDINDIIEELKVVSLGLYFYS